MGGSQKGNQDDYSTLIDRLEGRVKHLIILKSGISGMLETMLSDRVPVSVVPSLGKAVTMASSAAEPGDTVLLSPSAAGFYSQFIVGTKGYRRLVRELARSFKKKSGAK